MFTLQGAFIVSIYRLLSELSKFQKGFLVYALRDFLVSINRLCSALSKFQKEVFLFTLQGVSLFLFIDYDVHCVNFRKRFSCLPFKGFPYFYLKIMKYNDRSRRSMVFINRLSNPRGLVVYQKTLYYIDADYESIFSVSLNRPQSKYSLKANLVGLRTLKVFYDRHSKGKYTQ